MADRYWVGGTASWDGTAGTKWATTSGGTGGASVPTSADAVYFTSASTGTVTIATGNTGAGSINCTGFTGTLTGSASITVSGNITLATSMTHSYTGNITIGGTSLITSAGKTLCTGLTISISAHTASIPIYVYLNDALTLTGALNVTRGAFTTNSFNVTAGSLTTTGAASKIIFLNDSTVTLTSSSQTVLGLDNLGIELKTTKSDLTTAQYTINCTGSNISILGGWRTFYNLSLTSAATGLSNTTITGFNTFNNLSITGPGADASGGCRIVNIESQTVNGNFTVSGTAANRRVYIVSNSYGMIRNLTINGTATIPDCDFRDIRVLGTASPISGTRTGDQGGCTGVTFSTPKTVYLGSASTGNFSSLTWSTSSNGSNSSVDNIPLPQDTAIINNSGGSSLSLNGYFTLPTLDFSSRTSAHTINIFVSNSIYGNFILGSGITLSGSSTTTTFMGRSKTQTITSAGKTLNFSVTVDAYDGSVELSDNLNNGTNSLTVINGTFDTKNYAITCGTISSNNSNVRTINFGSSTVTISNASAISAANTLNLTVDAGTSQINCTSGSSTFECPNETFYNVSFTSSSPGTVTITGSHIFNNLSITPPSTAAVRPVNFSGNNTINGTLTVAGASPIRRITLNSNTVGTTRTLTVSSLSATDCDFRDITIAGAAANSSPTRAGDRGGNSGITFPASKTVYWNLAGNQDWSATAWCDSSGGTPNINNFPLAQDTAVFNQASSITSCSISTAWAVGTIDMSSRTSNMTFSISATGFLIFGDFKLGTGVTTGNTSSYLNFSKRNGTQTITSNGVEFNFNINIENLAGTVAGTVELGDALTLSNANARGIVFSSGGFDAKTYNITATTFTASTAVAKTIIMGTGTWTATGTSFDFSSSSNTIYKNTANILLSSTSTTSRTFAGGGRAYNKLTIGGTTGTSTTTISGNNTFEELASTKTVAHTIALGSTVQTFGKWTVTGTSGNVVTLTGTGTSHLLSGAATTGIDYLAMGSIGFSNTSPGEFYAGANSTGTANAPVYRTATPAARTLYWVGGTGNWSSTTKWSTASGGSSGAAVPTSLDSVIFNSSSNATAYTATVDATSRCNTLTITGPASGNVTLAGTAALIAHGNITLPATGLTRSYSGNLILSGSTTDKTLTTNGVSLGNIYVDGIGSEWSLGSALNQGTSDFILINGSFKTQNYNVTAGTWTFSYGPIKAYLGSSTILLQNTNAWQYNSVSLKTPNFVLDAGTSTINFGSSTANTFSSWTEPITVYNIGLTSTFSGSATFPAAVVTANNITITPISASGIKQIILQNNLVINSTLTSTAPTSAVSRVFIRSNTIGTTRTITCAAASLTDVDFRDITIAGAAAPVSGTRLGDCKGNSGITFPASKTVYWVQSGSNNISFNGWASEQNGAPATTNFPLAQDTCVFPSDYPSSGATITINATYNLGTIDMSARTTNTITIAGSSGFNIYGNWIGGLGTSTTATSSASFNGRNQQTITTSGNYITFSLDIYSPGGTVKLLDSFTSIFNGTTAINLSAGTFDANNYNVTIAGSTAGINASGSIEKTLALGSGTWSINGSGTPWNLGSFGTGSVTGTGTISLLSSSSKTFAGGGLNYSGITLDILQPSTLTITGNNTFKTISDSISSSGNTTINFGSTTTTITSPLALSGTSPNYIILQGTSSSSFANLIYTGNGNASNVNYLVLSNVKLYPINTWYVGSDSINGYFSGGATPGYLGAIFSSAPGTGIRSHGYIIQ